MSARPRPRRQSRSADETRARILAAALSEFAESGYRGASIGAIAARAELSQSGLLHHFPNNELLLAAVVERRTDDHRDEYQVAVEEDPDLGFLTGMVALMGRAVRERELTRLFTVVVAEATSPEHPAHDWTVRRYDVVTIDRAFANLVGRMLSDLIVDTPEAAARLAAWRARHTTT